MDEEENVEFEVSDDVYIITDPIDTSDIFDDYPVPEDPPMDVEGEGEPPEEDD